MSTSERPSPTQSHAAAACVGRIRRRYRRLARCRRPAAPTSSLPAPSMTSRVCLFPADEETGSRRRVEIVLRYGVGRLGVAVGGARPVRVRVVRQGCEGQRAGLAVGDEIVDVEGRDVSRAQPEVVAALLRSWTSDTLHLTVAREENDDSGHASSSSSSSPDDVTNIASGYKWRPTSRIAKDSQNSTSGKHFGGHFLAA